MNKHFKAVLLSVSLIFATVGHADAARLGGGRSIGKAPSAPMQKQAAPVQKPAQQAQPATPATAPQAPAPSRFGGMGGILGGLAAGLGIGYLLSHFGLGEAASSLIAGLLIAVLAGFAIMFVMRKACFLPYQVPTRALKLPLRGCNAQIWIKPQGKSPHLRQLQMPLVVYPSEPAPFQSTLPPGFDEYAFLDNAKQYFSGLQKAWDQGDLVALH